MNWFKNKQVHDDWLESYDWGTRCLVCGRATTNKRKQFWRTLNRFGAWFLQVMGFALTLSAIVLLILYVIHGKHLIAGDGISSEGIYDMFWIVLYAFLGVTFWYQREVIFSKEEKA